MHSFKQLIIFETSNFLYKGVVKPFENKTHKDKDLQTDNRLYWHNEAWAELNADKICSETAKINNECWKRDIED